MKSLTVTPKNKKELQNAKKQVQTKKKDNTPTYDDEVYSPEFIASILQAREDSKNGKGVEITIDELRALCE